MKTRQNLFARFWRDVRGISSVEYALLLAFVGIGIVGAAGALSTAVQTEMTDTADCITSVSGLVFRRPKSNATGALRRCHSVVNFIAYNLYSRIAFGDYV